jgi:CRP-like cAMP-binding protein
MKQSVDELELVPFLEALNEEALCSIAERATRKTVKRGKELRLGANGSGKVVVIGSGKAHLLRHAGNGRRFSLGVLGEGALAGDLGKGRRDGNGDSLLAVEDVVAYVFPKDAFAEVLRQHPEVAIGVTRVLAEQSREREAQLADLALRDVHRRAASVLGRLAEGHGTVGSEGVTIRVRITHQDLADMLGCSRESVTVALGELRRDGLVGVRDRHFVIPDLGRLKAEAALN